MAGRGRGLEVSATSTAPRPGVLRASCCRYRKCNESLVNVKSYKTLQETPCDCVPYAECSPFLEDVFSLGPLRDESPAQYRLGVQRLAAGVCDVQEQRVCCSQQRTLTGGQCYCLLQLSMLVLQRSLDLQR